MAKKKKLIIIGAGGHARSVIENAPENTFLGYVAPEPAAIAFGLPYEGDDGYIIANFNPDEFGIHLAIGFNDGCRLSLRRSIIERYKDFEAVTMISPSAIVTPNSVIEGGCAIMSRAVVNRSVLGQHCVVNTGAVIEHDCHIGTNVFIGPGAIICGEVTLGDDVFIGAGAVIRNGVSVCASASVGMGAVVTHDITEPGIYVGSPARIKETKHNG